MYNLRHDGLETVIWMGHIERNITSSGFHDAQHRHNGPSTLFKGDGDEVADRYSLLHELSCQYTALEVELAV